jgi:hypothetical protein
MKNRSTTRVLAGFLLTGLVLALEPACGDNRQGSPPTATPARKPPSENAKKSSHAVIFLDVDGKKVYPKSAYLWIGEDADDTREVWWISPEEDVKITFKAGNPQPVPADKIKCGPWGKFTRCRWTIGKKEIPFGTYGYDVTVKGVTLDPEVEIDR